MRRINTKTKKKTDSGKILTSKVFMERKKSFCFSSVFAFYISRGSVMATCKAHNLETENACVGSIPTPATKKKHNQ